MFEGERDVIYHQRPIGRGLAEYASDVRQQVRRSDDKSMVENSQDNEIGKPNVRSGNSQNSKQSKQSGKNGIWQMPDFAKQNELVAENDMPGADQAIGETPGETPDGCDVIESRPSLDVESNLNVPDNSIKEIFLPSLKDSKDPSIAPSFSDRDLFQTDFKPDAFQKGVMEESSREDHQTLKSPKIDYRSVQMELNFVK